MSNRFEIQEEFLQANHELATLCKRESHQIKRSAKTVTIEPQYGSEMNYLRDKCDRLQMILEAMEASED